MEGAILIDILTKLFFWQVVVKKYLKLDLFVMSIAYWSLDRFWSAVAIYFFKWLFILEKADKGEIASHSRGEWKIWWTQLGREYHSDILMQRRILSLVWMKSWGATNPLPSQGEFWMGRSRTGHRTCSGMCWELETAFQNAYHFPHEYPNHLLSTLFQPVPCSTLYSTKTTFW